MGYRLQIGALIKEGFMRKGKFFIFFVGLLFLFSFTVFANSDDAGFKKVEKKETLLKLYSKYSNKDRSWYYIFGKPFYKDKVNGINSEVEKLIKKYNAIYRVETNEKKIYLTFDEGYEYKNNSDKILDTLKSKDVKAHFFITGAFLKSNLQTVKRMIKEGHMVMSHTDKHLRAPSALKKSDATLINDIKNLENEFKEKTGEEIKRFIRPPEGGYSERSLKINMDLGYKTVFWSFAYRDWETNKQMPAKKAKDKILSQLHPGEIMLLHAVSKTNVDILPELIDAIRKRGYTFELMD